MATNKTIINEVFYLIALQSRLELAECKVYTILRNPLLKHMISDKIRKFIRLFAYVRSVRRSGVIA